MFIDVVAFLFIQIWVHMSKVGVFILGLLLGVLLPSLYAWKQVDQANMAKPEVRVIKEYVGQFRGWDDDCLNCEATTAQQAANAVNGLSSGKVMRGAGSVITRGRGKTQQGTYRGGYCECNCQQDGNSLRL